MENPYGKDYQEAFLIASQEGVLKILSCMLLLRHFLFSGMNHFLYHNGSP